jgi:hypothetical protein
MPSIIAKGNEGKTEIYKFIFEFGADREDGAVLLVFGSGDSNTNT